MVTSNTSHAPKSSRKRGSMGHLILFKNPLNVKRGSIDTQSNACSNLLFSTKPGSINSLGKTGSASCSSLGKTGSASCSSLGKAGLASCSSLGKAGSASCSSLGKSGSGSCSRKLRKHGDKQSFQVKTTINMGIQ